MSNQCPTNKFEGICVLHGKECGLYCPICNKYRCDQCYDDHITSGNILHGCQIYDIIKAKSFHYSDSIIYALSAKLNSAIDMIKHYYAQRLNQISGSNFKAMELYQQLPIKAKESIASISKGYNATCQLNENKNMLLLIKDIKALFLFAKGLNLNQILHSNCNPDNILIQLRADAKQFIIVQNR